MDTQTAHILKHLCSGKSITPLEALQLYGSFRLGAIIFNLREAGHDIDTIMVQQGKKRFARYILSSKQMEML